MKSFTTLMIIPLFMAVGMAAPVPTPNVDIVDTENALVSRQFQGASATDALKNVGGVKGFVQSVTKGIHVSGFRK